MFGNRKAYKMPHLVNMESGEAIRNLTHPILMLQLLRSFGHTGPNFLAFIFPCIINSWIDAKAQLDYLEMVI